MNELDRLKDDLRERVEQNESADVAVKGQIEQFMDFITEEKNQQTLLRVQMLELNRENKRLKQ